MPTFQYTAITQLADRGQARGNIGSDDICKLTTKFFFVRGELIRLSPAELEEVSKQLTHLTKQGWIRPSLGPWGSPVLFQRKKNSKLSMCVDFTGRSATTQSSMPILCHA
jgi:hypothetical protein